MGSEMCIRDRRSSDNSTSIVGDGNGATAPSSLSAWAVMTKVAIAVMLANKNRTVFDLETDMGDSAIGVRYISYNRIASKLGVTKCTHTETCLAVSLLGNS